MASPADLVRADALVAGGENCLKRVRDQMERVKGAAAGGDPIALQLLATMRDSLQLMRGYRDAVQRELPPGRVRSRRQ